MARILLIEDEDNIRKIIAYDLKKADFDIVECGDGRTAVDLAMKEDFDVLIIDWMLPHVSGIDIVKKLRSEHIDAIFIMLTARDDETISCMPLSRAWMIISQSRFLQESCWPG